MVGSSLGPYEILEPLGAGGMGEVYLARDTRLERKVAIKVLPAEFAADRERLQRFEREARAAAALNHPHICAVHDIGDDGGTHYIVEEFLDGHTLRGELDRGSLPLQRALTLGVELAEGLAAAHSGGIVHRDLKPENVFVTGDGHVKILDFGLAKLVDTSPGISSTGSGVTMSPTRLATAEGKLLGTAGYMAPEQIEGREVDARADLFAFGCLLYEMVGRAHPFAGKSAPDTMSRILHEEPGAPLLAELSDLPAELWRILSKCLAKDPAERYQHADDLVVDLRAHARDLELGRAVMMGASTEPPAPATTPRWVWPALGLATAAVLVLAALLTSESGPSPDPVRRFEVALPIEVEWPTAAGRTLSISPDGSLVAFVASGEGDRHLQLWDLERGAGRRLAETQTALHPFFSPDGAWIGFVQSGQLRKMALDDGRVIDLAAADNVTYGNWGDDGSIVYSRRDGLYRVPSQGGRPVLLVAPDRDAGEIQFNRPAYLPGSQAVLFEIVHAEGARIAALSLASGEVHALVASGTFPEYAANGYLLFARGTSLYGARFDASSLRLVGQPLQVLQGIAVTSGAVGGAAHYAIANDGTLVFVDGEIVNTRDLVWVDRAGVEAPAVDQSHVYRHPQLSPDGDRIAVSIEDPTDPARQDIWLIEPAQRTFRRLTFSGENFYPRWSPDGGRIGFTGRRGEIAALFAMPSDFSQREPDSVLGGDNEVFNGIVSPDGAWLVYRESHPETGRDVMIRPADGSGTARPLLASPFDEHSAVLSPDGRWIAFVSNETGRDEILVTTFPDPGGRWQVSNEGGTEPIWSRSGTEIFYRDGSQLVAVRVASDPEFRHLGRELLFERSYFAYRYHQQYDVDLAAERFLFIRLSDDPGDRQSFSVILNWLDGLGVSTGASGGD